MQCRLLSQPENFLSSGHRPGEFPVRNPAGRKGLSAVFHKSYPECRVSLRSVPDRQIRTGLCRLLFSVLLSSGNKALLSLHGAVPHGTSSNGRIFSHSPTFFLTVCLPGFSAPVFQADGTEVPTAGKLSAADG